MDFKKLFEVAKANGFSDIEVYEIDSKKTSISLFNGEVDKTEMSDTKNFTIRAILNGKMAYANVEDEDENIDELILKLKDNASVINTDEEFFIYEGDLKYPSVTNESDNFFEIPTSDKIALLNNILEEAKKSDPRVFLMPMCLYSEQDVKVRIINSKGLDITKSSVFAYAGGQVVSKDNEETKTAFHLKAVKKFNEFDPIKIGKEAAKKAVDKLGGEPCESGNYPVIIEREAMGDLFQAFVSMFSGESALKKVTSLLGKENKKIMGENITIIDDPLYPNALNSQPFDDEGVACYTKEVVTNGVFNGFLHNLKTAKYFNTKSTGNGFKAGTNIGVSGCNIYIKAGEKSLDEMISSINKGILITEVGGLHAGVNPISGDFSVQSSGFMIENGKKGKPVTLIVLSGNFIKAMNEVEMIGNDLEISHETESAPSIKFKGLQISGK